MSGRRFPHQMMSTVDATFCIEAAAFNQLHRDEGIKIMRQRIISSLPTTSTPKTLQQSAQLLDQLVAGPLYKWGSKDVQNQVSAVQEVLTGMRNGSAPDMTYMRGADFLAKVAERLPLFLQATNSSGKTVLGKAAMSLRFAALADKKTKGTLSFEHLSDINAYSFLLTSEQQKSLANYTNDLLKTVKTSSKRKMPTASASSSSAPKKKGSKTNDATASAGVDDAVAKLFG